MKEQPLPPDAAILVALQKDGGSVSGADLAQELKITRSAVWARIHSLRELGYDIEASPHGGYRLRAVPDRLHGDYLISLLERRRVIGRDIRVFEETTSTSDMVERLARGGAGEGVVVFAESQTQGRGRLGRVWASPPGKGLWFSVLLRPAWRPQLVTRVMIGAAVALARAIRQQTNLAPEIKWPNDILIRGKKLAGILTELSAELDKIKHVNLGVGINVNLSSSDFPSAVRSVATSIKIELGRSVNRCDLAAQVLRELDGIYASLGEGEFDGIAHEWERQCTTLGQNVAVQVGDREIRGRAEALDAEGALLVRTSHGRLERVAGGDVRVEH